MTIYVSMAFWLGLCALLGNRHRNVVWFNIFILSLINGLRDISIGIDTSNYYDIWNWISQGVGDYIEPGWYWLTKIIQYLGGSYNFFLWVIATMTFIPIGYAGKKVGYNPSLILLFYYLITFYLQSFNVMRQILAISFVLLGYLNLANANKKRYFIWVCIAFLFHYSSIVALIVNFVPRRINSSRKKIVNLLLGSLLGSFLLTPNFLSIIIGRYAVYLQDGAGIRENVLSAYILGCLVNILYIIIYKTMDSAYRESWFMKTYLAGIIFMNLTTQLELGTRIILYFTILQIIVFPMYILHNRFKNRGIAAMLVFTYAIVLFFKLLIGDPLEICPYKFYFV